MRSFTAQTFQQLPRLVNENVHLWKVDLRHKMEKEAQQLLNQEEQIKASRLRNVEQQAFAISMRVQLRQLLALYLAVKAKDIQFKKAAFGKPYVANVALSFNVSHSGEQALIAISKCKQLGVDIERWRTLDNIEALVRRNFSEQEKKQWLTVAREQREKTFFQIWTSKEAFIKATGRGLGIGVSKCGFELESPHGMELCPPEYGDASSWQCHSLDVGEKVSAKLIVKASTCDLKTYTFSPENAA